jgi:hypothetical protein
MEGTATVTAKELSTISADDLRASRVFTGGLASDKK